jgi:hypothetical protein
VPRESTLGIWGQIRLVGGYPNEEKRNNMAAKYKINQPFPFCSKLQKFIIRDY